MLVKEEIIFEGKISKWTLLPEIISMLFGVVCVLFSFCFFTNSNDLVILGCFLLVLGLACIWPYIKASSTKYTITNRKVITQWGVFITSTEELRLNKIESIEIKACGIFEWLFGVKSIHMSGTGTNHVWFRKISEYQRVKDLIESAIENYDKE